MHIQSPFPGLSLSLPEAGPEIPVQEGDAVLLCQTLRRAAERLAEQYGVPFLYRDFRPGFRQGQAEARERGLYMQKYCGCVFSEEDRYAKQIKRDQEKFHV